MAENLESIIIWGRVCLRRCSQSESGSFWPQSQGLFDHLNHLRRKATSASCAQAPKENSASSFFSDLGFASGSNLDASKAPPALAKEFAEDAFPPPERPLPLPLPTGSPGSGPRVRVRCWAALPEPSNASCTSKSSRTKLTWKRCKLDLS